jgi:hypothetical protein
MEGGGDGGESRRRRREKNERGGLKSSASKSRGRGEVVGKRVGTEIVGDREWGETKVSKI